MNEMELNRRGFISSLAVCFAWTKKSKAKSIDSPAASASQPTCCACGADWHVTSGCPINNTAMGLVSAIWFDCDISTHQAEAFIEYHFPGVRWHEFGGQRVFPVINQSGNLTDSFIAYALPKWMVAPWGVDVWPGPDTAQLVVSR